MFPIMILLGLVATTSASSTHDVSTWDSEEAISDALETVTVDDMSMTKLKKDFEITNKSQSLKVDFYNLFTRTVKTITQPGKLVRITAMVFVWIPQANNLLGKTTLSLTDGRKAKSDGNRIESQVTFRPDKPVIGVFYHNYAMTIADLKYMDLEFIMHGINMDKGSMGRLSFGYKTIMTGPTYYMKKDPEVFYLPIEQLPELSVETPTDIYVSFIEKMKKKKSQEVEYFSNLQKFIDLTKRPINAATANQQALIDDLKRDLHVLNKYQDDAQKFKLQKEKVSGLESAIADTEKRIHNLMSAQEQIEEPMNVINVDREI
ncbi:putative movement protein [Karaka Okahu purepure emaravirus]|uniref:Movement protein n=1 Tax=Karaka Okahu purepure emaravirus TaxID=2872811 RepID=A0AAX1PCX0_9VIRU|nr:putative movement protein [Karaka Okahu purepure emaravirus]QZN83756.1 putative movement protein [Karaka Okahu purepure emaravirus]